MINRLPWRKKLRNTAANNLDKLNEVIDYINHSDISPVALSENGSGYEITVGTASSVKSLGMEGKAIQDGTPTPDNPVPIEVVKGRDLLNPNIGLEVTSNGVTTVTPITLPSKGSAASLPNGTKDVLTVDSAGRVDWDVLVGEVDLGTLNWQYDSTNDRFFTVGLTSLISKGSTGWINNLICSSYVAQNGVSNDKTISEYASTGYVYIRDETYDDATSFKTSLSGVMLYYQLATPTTETTYIDLPEIPDSATVKITASMQVEFDMEWWVYDDVTDMIRALKKYTDWKVEV